MWPKYDADRGMGYVGADAQEAYLIVSCDGILKRLIGRTVTHHSAIILCKDPVVALPEVTDLQAKFILRLFQPHQPFCQKGGDGNGAVRGFGFGGLAYRFSVYKCDGLCDLYNVLLKVNIAPLKSQQFSLSQASINREDEQNPHLFRDIFCDSIVSNRVRDSSVIHPFVAGYTDSIRFLNVGEKCVGLVWREKLDFFFRANPLQA